MQTLDTTMLKTITNVWKFPKNIDFETASNYINSIGNLNFREANTFDLTETESVHTSFIGFLIDLKQNIDHRGGKLNLKLSPYLEKLFTQIGLYDHFFLRKAM